MRKKHKFSCQRSKVNNQNHERTETDQQLPQRKALYIAAAITGPVADLPYHFFLQKSKTSKASRTSQMNSITAALIANTYPYHMRIARIHQTSNPHENPIIYAKTYIFNFLRLPKRHSTYLTRKTKSFGIWTRLAYDSTQVPTKMAPLSRRRGVAAVGTPCLQI